MSFASEEKYLSDLVKQLLNECDPAGSRIDFLGRQFDLGLAWVHFGEGYGGLGVAPKLQSSVNAQLAEAIRASQAPLLPFRYISRGSRALPPSDQR